MKIWHYLFSRSGQWPELYYTKDSPPPLKTNITRAINKKSFFEGNLRVGKTVLMWNTPRENVTANTIKMGELPIVRSIYTRTMLTMRHVWQNGSCHDRELISCPGYTCNVKLFVLHQDTSEVMCTLPYSWLITSCNITPHISPCTQTTGMGQWDCRETQLSSTQYPST